MRLRFIEGFLNKISLIQKIFILFFGCVIIPLFLQNIFYFTQVSKGLQAEISSQLTLTLDSIGNKLDASFYDALSLTVRYYNDARIYRCLDGHYDRDMAYLNQYLDNVEPMILNDLPFHMQLDEIVFYTDNPTIFNGAMVRKLIPFEPVNLGELIHEGSIIPLSGQKGPVSLRIGLRYIPYEKYYQRMLAITRGLSSYRELNVYQKMVRVDLNSTYYTSLLSDTSLFANLLVVDEENRVLFCANTFRQSGTFDRFDPQSLGSGIILLRRELKNLPLTLYGYYDTNIITAQFQRSFTGTLAISGVGIAIAVFFLLIIGHSLTKRTNAIVAKAAQIAQGDFAQDTVYLAQAGGDEMVYIERNIEKMGQQLQIYIENEYKAKLARSELEKEITQAKLQALQSQVNPHFLFNALESIRLNALDKGRDETVRMIKDMSKMFRYLVDWQGDMVVLEQELAFLGRFLEIQQYRFGNEFHYTIQVQEEAKACLLPKLILQPLVENACVHGVEATSNVKHIAITVAIVMGALVMQVSDNGGGMPPARLAQLQHMLGGGEKCGDSVGLYNVYQRLWLQYHGGFDFDIDSQQGQGTVCTVRIPAQFEPHQKKEIG